MLVDGYNASKLGWFDLPIAEQRRRLVDALTELVMRTDADVSVVFDGAEPVWPAPVPTTARLVQVSFSPPDVEADDVILARRGRPRPVPPGPRRLQRPPGARRLGGPGRQRDLLRPTARRAFVDDSLPMNGSPMNGSPMNGSPMNEPTHISERLAAVRADRTLQGFEFCRAYTEAVDAWLTALFAAAGGTGTAWPWSPWAATAGGSCARAATST